ncbi:MAG: ion channel [Deltaproteobacteria bacterium]|nr:ion channel [Deltaproteobacteria bacterium]
MTQQQTNLLQTPRGIFSRVVRRFRNMIRTVVRHGAFQIVVVFVMFVVVGAEIDQYLEGEKAESPFHSYFNSLWFTMVTITTVGYGDMTPLSTPARIWAMFQMLTGIALVGVVTGNMASFLVERNRKRAMGLVRVKGLSGHVIVCGWKPDMMALLLGMLRANPDLTSAQIVVVAERDPKEIGELRLEPSLRHLHFVFGSHTDPAVMRMAGTETSGRVIILAEMNRSQDKDRADSRTVLAATTVESLNSEVYTVTEILQPHYSRYLRKARVEDVVLTEDYARSLLAVGSLGDGVANAISLFFPEKGGQLRVLPVPQDLIGQPFGMIRERLESQGLLAIGVLLNTGNLRERKEEQMRLALRQSQYKEALHHIHQVRSMVSNAPMLAPPDDFVVPRFSSLMALLPNGKPVEALEQQYRSEQYPQVRDPRPERLFICGWRDQMAELLDRIISQHMACQRKLAGVTVLSTMPEREANAIDRAPGLAGVRVIRGEPTDPEALRTAGIRQAHRVLVLADNSGGSHQENDARSVLTGIAVQEINRRIYKCVELQDVAFSEHLELTTVEEPVFTRRLQQVLLAESAHGAGMASAIGGMVDPLHASLRVVDFPPGQPGDRLEVHALRLKARGYILVGVVDHCGNIHSRKRAYLEEAQVQPRIAGALQHLNRLKDVVSNHPILHPGWDFIPGEHSRAIVLVPPIKASV